MKLTRDISVTYMRVIFTVWILIFHCFNEFLPSASLKTFPIHNIEELEFMRGVTKCVLMGFVFISGLLMARGYFDGAYSDTRHFILDKCKRLLVPYCFWSLGLVILYNVSWIQVLDGAKHLWFLLMLFEVMVIAIFMMPIIRRTGWNIDLSLLFLIIVATAILGKYFSAPYILDWHETLIYFPAFYIGIMMVKYRLDERILFVKSFQFYGASVLIIICTAIVSFTTSLPYGSFYINIPYLLTPPTIYLIIKRLCSVSQPASYIMSLDRNSLGIYILHQFIGKYTLLYYIPEYYMFYDTHPFFAPGLLFIQMLFLSWIGSDLLHRTYIGSFLLGGSTKRKI